MRTILIITTVALLASASSAGEIPVADPASVGMSAEGLERLTAATQEFVDEGRFPGVLTMVGRNGRIVHVSAVGRRGAEDDRPLTEDALFRIYSMTKPITAVAAMMLYEDGVLRLDDPVAEVVPELAELEVLGFGLVTALGEEGVGSVGEYSWGGAAGTVFWIDPVEEIVVIGMVQLMASPWPLREKLKALTYEAITERAAPG